MRLYSEKLFLLSINQIFLHQFPNTVNQGAKKRSEIKNLHFKEIVFIYQSCQSEDYPSSDSTNSSLFQMVQPS